MAPVPPEGWKGSPVLKLQQLSAPRIRPPLSNGPFDANHPCSILCQYVVPKVPLSLPLSLSRSLLLTVRLLTRFCLPLRPLRPCSCIQAIHPPRPLPPSTTASSFYDNRRDNRRRDERQTTPFQAQTPPPFVFGLVASLRSLSANHPSLASSLLLHSLPQRPLTGSNSPTHARP